MTPPIYPRSQPGEICPVRSSAGASLESTNVIWISDSDRLTVPEPTKAVITLSRLNTRSFDTMPLGPDITFQYAIVKHGESQPIRITPVSATTRLTLELNLEAGLYLVYVGVIPYKPYAGILLIHFPSSQVKVEHRWSLTDTDISHCDLNPGVSLNIFILSTKLNSSRRFRSRPEQ